VTATIPRGACCTWDTFWTDGFVRHWNNFFRLPTPIPAYIERKARSYWTRYAMTGWEAFETIKVAETLYDVPRPPNDRS
jgi:hypothetical protein